MTMIRGLVGLSFICTAAGFAGPISARPRPAGRSSSSSTSFKSSARQQAPQLMRGWRSSNQRTRTCMTAQQEGDTSEAAPAAPAPRLKRVRRRRKDGGASVAVAGEEEEDGKASSTAVVEEQAPPPASPPAVAAAAQVVAPPPAVVAPPAVPAPAEQVQRVAAVEEEEDPRSVGGTKGTKVRVVDTSDDDMSEKLAGVASAASGAAGGAASAVSGAAKSAVGAAMSMLGQGAPAADEFDLDSMPAPGERGQARRPGKRTTPGKTASELADLGADIERFRRAENRQPETAGESIASGAKDIISTIISIDFFVVIAFMLWFIAGVVSSYGFSNTFLLDQFNDKWTPVVQPALGVLMGGTIAGGVVSKLGESGDDEDDNRQ